MTPRKLQAIFGWVFILLFIVVTVLAKTSAMTAPVRLLIVLTIVVALCNILLYFTRLGMKYGTLRFPLLFLLLFFVLWTVVYKKSPNSATLRAEYVHQLRRYGDAGKSDVPGLARAALCHAMFQQGLREANPTLLGPKLWLFWWRDLTTNDLLIMRYGYTKMVAPDLLNDGDLAVQQNKVLIIEAGREKINTYENKPVVYLRWWIL